MTLEAAQLLGSDYQGLGQMPQRRVIYGQKFKQESTLNRCWDILYIFISKDGDHTVSTHLLPFAC